MKLRKIRIENFKSIEDGIIEEIGDLEIFCGKNNAGKTAIFEALQTLRQGTLHPEVSHVNLPDNLVTGKDFTNQQLKITVGFELNNSERSIGIKRYFPEIPKDYLDELIGSSFLSRIEYSFESFEGSPSFGFHNMRIQGSDGEFGQTASRKNNGQLSLTNIALLMINRKPLTAETLANQNTTTTDPKGVNQPTFDFPFRLLKSTLQKMHVFPPFRRSLPIAQATLTNDLAGSGENLVQRIFTIKQNEDQNWTDLRGFVDNIFPEVGSLQSRVIDNSQTKTVFEDKKWQIEVDLHDVGEGAEQLLIMAEHMISKSDDSLILIENPELHFHPGAQRIFLKFIRDNLGDHQILLTTHSPTFLSQRDLSMHKVSKSDQGTKIKKVKELGDLSEALAELGSRNSDLLLADSVLFVEGPSDEKILRAWAKTLKLDLDYQNVFFIRIGGSRNFYYYANSDVLRRVSQKSPIPHLLIIDRDEKSKETLRKIQEQLPQARILEAREIENYLLIPEHVLECMRMKSSTNSEATDRLKGVQADAVEKLILSEVEGLRKTVLFKRVQEEIGGMRFIPDSLLQNLLEGTRSDDPKALTAAFYKAIAQILDGKCGISVIKKIVEEQHFEIDRIWKEPNIEDKKRIVSGKEILKKVYHKYGLAYDNVKDGEKIAQRMKPDEIPQEIKEVFTYVNETLKQIRP